MSMGTSARMRVLLGNPRRALLTAGTVTAVATMAVLPFALRAAASAAPELTAASSVTTRAQEASATATCGRGYTAVGVSAELSGFADVRISKMWPQGRTATARGTASSPVTSPWTLRVQAICVKDSAGIEAQTSTAWPGFTIASASCAPGRTLVGFGWAAGGDGRISGVNPYRGGSGGWPTGSGGYPTGTGGWPTGTGQYPTGTGGWPTGTGQYPTGTGGWPTGTGQYPTGTGQYPTGTGQYPTGTGQYPTGTGQYPTGTGQYPTGTGQYPTGTGQYPTGTGGYPTGTGQYPTGTGGYPTGTGQYPTGTGGYPTGGYPTGTGQYPTGTGQFPTGTGGYPTGGGGTGPYTTVVATTPLAQDVSVTAICARADFGVTATMAAGVPGNDGTLQISSRCASDSEVSSLGFTVMSGSGKLRTATVGGNGRTGKLVVTHPDRQSAGPGSLTTLCSF